jgi:ribosomal protein S18 acetylase RimI-like enzyme
VDLDETWIDAAAEIAAASFGPGTSTFARRQIKAIRSRPNGHAVGLFTDGELVAVYGLLIGPQTTEMAFLAVAEQCRGFGHGRTCLLDAIERSNGQPVVVETDDDAVDFYRACGWDSEEVRTPPHGRTRYRLRSRFNG